MLNNEKRNISVNFRVSKDEIPLLKKLLFESGTNNQNDFIYDCVFGTNEKLIKLKQKYIEIQKQQYVNNKLILAVLLEIMKNKEKDETKVLNMVNEYHENLQKEAEEEFKI